VSDVFISYARSTEALADRMTDALRSLGYAVWRDDQLPAHRAYGEVIEERLHNAKAVVVIWSADALQSVWVRSEADRARMMRKLVQLSVDGTRLPMPFDQIQCADLVGWAGDPDHRGFRKVIESVAELVSDGAAGTGGTRVAPAVFAHAEPPPVQASAAGGEVSRTVVREPPPAARAEDPAVAAPPPAPAAPPRKRPEIAPAAPSPVASYAPVADAAREVVDAPADAARPGGPTIIAQAPPTHEELIPELVGAPAVAARAEASAVTELAPSAASRRPGPPVALIAISAVAAVVAVAGGIWLASVLPGPHRPSPAPAALAPHPGSAAPAPLNPAYQQIAQAAAALPDDAHSQGRPAGETAQLTQLATQIDGLLAQLHGAPATQVPALTAQLNQAAATGAQAEAATLTHAGEAMAGEAESTLRGGGASADATQALAALRSSTQSLGAAAAGVSSATDAAGSLTALRAALAAWGQVRADYTSAAAFYAPALRTRFQAAADAARAEAQRVIAGAASASRPWLFASREQKDAYKALQDHAAEAKTDLGQLDGLAQSAAASSDVRQLRADIARAGEIRGSLAALAASAPASGH